MARNTCLPFRTPTRPVGLPAGTSSTLQHAPRRKNATRPRTAEGGKPVVTAVQLLTEYAPRPPHDAGSPRKAPARPVEEFRAGSRFSLTWTGST